MPLLQTDIAAGAKAAAEQQLLPTQVEEKLKQLPIETQKLQQQLQKGTQDLQKGEQEMQEHDIKLKEEAIKLQQMVAGVEQDKDTRDASAKYFADPTNQSKPMHQQMQELGKIIAGKGNLKLAETVFKDADQALLREEQAALLKAKRDDLEEDKLRFWAKSMTPENINEIGLDMMAHKGMDPEKAGQLLKSARAAAGDPALWKEFMKRVDHEVGSVATRRLEQQADKLANDQKNKDRTADQRDEEARRREDRWAAARSSGDTKVTDRLAEQEFTHAEKIIRDTTRQAGDIHKLRRIRDELRRKQFPDDVKEPEKTNWRGQETDAHKAWQDRQDAEKTLRKDEDESLSDLQEELDDAKAKRDRAVTLSSSRLETRLGKDGVPSNIKKAPVVPKNNEEKAPEKGTQGSSKDAEALAWADANPKDPRAEAIRKKASGTAQAPAKTAPAQEVPKKQSNARDETFARGDKFNDPELNKFKLLSQSASGNVSINAYVDYVARLKKLEAK